MSLSPVTKYLVRRLVIVAIVLAGISIVSFGTVYLLPSDPITARFPQLSEEERAAVQHYMGLDQPILTQYAKYMEALSHGDLGWSYNTGSPVLQDIKQRLPASLELSFAGLCVALVIAIPLGIIAAVHRNSLIDHLTRLFSIGTLSMPVFWLSLVGIYIFFYELHWVPAPLGRLALSIPMPQRYTGFLTIDSLISRDWPAFIGALKSLALPAFVFGLSMVAPLTRITRSAMSEALQEDYITFARAVGIPERDVVMRDAFRGSMVALFTMIGYIVGFLIAGDALVEQVFSWPGIGRYAVQAVVTSDMAAVNAVLLIVAVGVASTNLLVDLSYAVVDPRIRHGLMG